VGGPPRSYDWNPPLARALGYASERSRRWDAEHPRWPHAHTVVQHFGSWSAGLFAAGMPATVREFDLPVAERVAVARRMAAEGISQAKIADYLGASARAVRNYLRAGDCESCATPLAAPTARHCRGCAARMLASPERTAPSILAAMRQWERETGLQPTVKTWGGRDSALSKRDDEHPRWPSSGQVIACFGSWTEALRQAGFAPLKRTWTREEVIAVLREAARTDGIPPRQSQWGYATASRPAASTVRNLFGSWKAALAAAGLNAPSRGVNRPERSQAHGR
jgi:hypothetical protein